jgi:hypothetical protein
MDKPFRTDKVTFTIQDYVRSSEMLEEKFPELWAKCYPRRYEVVGSYDSPKVVARAMMDGILSYLKKGSKQTQEIEALWASSMYKFSVPTYYLTYDLTDSLLKTRPTEIVDWLTMKLPFEAAAFMLPKDLLPHPGEYGYISFISYSRNFNGSCVSMPDPIPGRKWDLHNFNDTFNIIARVNTGCTLHWTLDKTWQLIDFKTSEELVETAASFVHESRDSRTEETSFNSVDEDVVNKAIRLLFNILLLMTHKAELIEPGKLLKKVKKSNKSVEYWSPHYIGRNYKLHRQPHPSLGGTHASPRLHWVSGFWKEQPYGPQMKLRRTLWIEPYVRGLEDSKTDGKGNRNTSRS